jgi:hypothetical protein
LWVERPFAVNWPVAYAKKNLIRNILHVVVVIEWHSTKIDLSCYMRRFDELHLQGRISEIESSPIGTPPT